MNHNEHVTSWIGAYHDNELRGRRLKMVEEHMSTCPLCQAELDSLQMLSSILLDTPEIGYQTPQELFVAQVGYQLDRKPVNLALSQVLMGGLQLAPAGLLGVWAFIQAAFIVTGIIGFSLDLFPDLERIVALLPNQGGPNLFSLFNIFNLGILNFGRFGLDLLGASNLLGSKILINLSLMTIGGFLYLSWLAIWWVQKSNTQDLIPSHGNFRRNGVNQ